MNAGGALNESPAVDATAAQQAVPYCPTPGRQDALRRAATARRCEPVEGRYGAELAARDPYLPWPSRRCPSTFGLSGPERSREAARLLEDGWGSWEVALVLVDPAVAEAS